MKGVDEMRRLLPLAAAAGALFLVISCASTPPQKPAQPAPEQPKEQPPAQAQAAAPDAELAQAKDLKQKVDAWGLGDYAPDDYAAANKDLQAGEDAYGKDNAASKKSLDSAITGYNAVIAKGGPQFLAKSQSQADASKKAADDLKASVAVKDDYAKADATYQQALKEKDAMDIGNASKDFDSARDQFDAVAKTAQQKKDAALQAMQSAQEEQSASQKKADDAEKSLKDEGITVPAGQ
jgi:hypothetical protein